MKQVSSADRSQFNRLVTHPLQSWAWGEFKAAQGQKVERFFIETNGQKQAGQVFFHTLPALPYTVGYFPKGPQPTSALVDALKELAQKHGAVFIKLEPNVVINRISPPSQDQKKTIITPQEEVNKKLTKLGLVPGRTLFTKHTMIINLEKDREQLLQDFHSKTRYNVRYAKRKGVKVVEDNSQEAFEKYWQLMEKTTERQGFYAHDKTYHKQMWHYMYQSDIAHLLVARYQEEILAAWILFKFHDTLYYPYGASSRRHRNVMASNRLMWEAICLGQETGCKRFDLWGTPGPNPTKDDPWYGFHRFKLGYDPAIVEFMGTFDWPDKPILYRGFKLANQLRWLILNQIS